MRIAGMPVHKPKGPPWTCGQIAAILNVHSNTIRRAEREGRLAKPEREIVSGFRFYNKEDLARLCLYFYGTPNVPKREE